MSAESPELTSPSYLYDEGIVRIGMEFKSADKTLRYFWWKNVPNDRDLAYLQAVTRVVGINYLIGLPIDQGRSAVTTGVKTSGDRNTIAVYIKDDYLLTAKQEEEIEHEHARLTQ